MLRTKLVDPRHVAARLLPESMKIVREIYKENNVDGWEYAEEAYVPIVPDARFLTFVYPFGSFVRLRIVGLGTKPVDVRGPRFSVLCSGHKNVVSQTRRISMRSTGHNRSQLRYEQDDSFLTQASQAPVRRVVDWRSINNDGMGESYRADMKVIKPINLIGEVVWLPRRRWDPEEGDLYAGIIRPSWDNGTGRFRVPEYRCPPEVKDKAGNYCALKEANILKGVIKSLPRVKIKTPTGRLTPQFITGELRRQWDIALDSRLIVQWYKAMDVQYLPSGSYCIAIKLHTNVVADLFIDHNVIQL